MKMTFNQLGVNHFYTHILEENYIIEPTPIQEMAIPIVSQGKDLIAEAQTGTGKTLAFLLPTLQNIDLGNPAVSVLIIAPTRELAIQITQVAKMFIDISVLNIYGGQDFTAQLHALSGKVDVIIATPGRLLHHLSRGRLELSKLQALVIDEADNLFKGGFMEEIEEIMTYLPKEKQTLLFSATIDKSVKKFAKKYLGEVERVTAPKQKITLDNIEQRLIKSSNRQKIGDLLEIFKRDHPERTIVFCRSRRGVDTLTERLVEEKLSVEKLHGGLSQMVRETVMDAFRQGQIKILVTTDVVARGIDVSGVSHVINYNLPDLPEDYVHRIGRTGRAGYSGVAYTLLTGKDEERMKKIEDYIEMKIPKYALKKQRKDNPETGQASDNHEKVKENKPAKANPSKRQTTTDRRLEKAKSHDHFKGPKRDKRSDKRNDKRKYHKTSNKS